MQSVIAKQQVKREQIYLVCVYRQWKSTKSWRALIHRVITKQWVKNVQTSVYFLKVIKFQENKAKIIQKNF